MLYFGAGGVIWALDYLARVGATNTKGSFTEVVEELIARNRSDFKQMPYPEASSYLMGDVGLLLLRWRLAPSNNVADQLSERIEANNLQPVLELMWGTSGTMLAALFMFDWTGESRWETLFLQQADRLWNEWEAEPGSGYLWTQNLYGTSSKYLGPVHGFAGNLVALLRGSELLAPVRLRDLYSRASVTMVKTALADGSYANWPAVADAVDASRSPLLVQYCHGAPGMVISLADLPYEVDPNADRLLEKGGELIWKAGPLTKGPGLCHGTAGNGYAFLKLFHRTRNKKWLIRARAFAMHAIAQYTRAWQCYGQGRYSLWTGDLGLALYLRDCIAEEARFPSIDIF